MRLIDADALADKFKTIYMNVENVAISHRVITSVDLMLAPTIDAEPVQHGRWESECEPHYKCSCCGHWMHLYQPMSYCPNCGAKMDGKPLKEN